MICEPDFSMLRQYFELGCFLYAQRWNKEKDCLCFVDWTKQCLPPTREKRAMLHGESELAGALENGVRVFSFRPHSAGLVCFAVSKEGESKWNSFCYNEAFDCNANTVVCEAPGGVRHHYFKDDGDCFFAGEIAPGIGVYGARLFGDMLVAGGSVTSGLYRLSDDLRIAPSIPSVLFFEAKRCGLVMV